MLTNPLRRKNACVPPFPSIANGWTTSTATAVSCLQIPGTLFRVGQDEPSPVTLGSADPYAYWYQLGERRLSPSTTGANALVFPSSEPDFFTSGYAEGHESLKGSAALVDEARGQGRVILFSGEPNFRAYTEGSSFYLANSIVYPLSAAPQTVDRASAAAASDVAAAMASSEPEFGPGRPIRIEVPARSPTPRWRSSTGSRRTFRSSRHAARRSWRSRTPWGSTRGSTFSRDLPLALIAAGVTVRSAIL